MSIIINARSPFFIKVVPVGTEVMTGANIDIKIWSGSQLTPPVDISYQINKTVIGSNNFLNIEISPLIRDFLETEYYDVVTDTGDIKKDAVWVDIQATPYDINNDNLTTISYDYLAFDGYGYFNDGVNPRTLTDPTTANGNYTPQSLIDNRIIYFKRGEDIRIPIFSETQAVGSTTISGVWDFTETYWEQSNINWDSTSTDQSLFDSQNSKDKIQYLIVSSDQAVTGDTITITSTAGNLQVDTFTLREIDCGQYDEYRVVFYNKYGALQDVYMPKKSTKSLAVKSEEYKRNIFNSDLNNYNPLKHEQYTFNAQGNESISVNSEFIPEAFNTVFEQLFLSEQVWLSLGIQVFAVKLKSKSFSYKTLVNDTLIQYGLDLEYSNNFINTVR